MPHVTETLMGLAREAEARDPFTTGHCGRLANYAMAFGIVLQLPDADLVTLCRGSFLHDLGKIAIPGSLLLKPDTLTRDEYDMVKQHTKIGSLLCEAPDLEAVRAVVRSHHERADGGGYPDGLTERQTPLVAQIVGLVDAYDGLTTQRPYHGARSSEEACATLLDEAQRGWRSVPLVREFVALARTNRFARLRREAVEFEQHV
jgi:putative two-component system response regulator